MDDNLVESFQNRVGKWKKEFTPPKIVNPKFDEIKVPIDTTPPIANRYATGKGIQSKDRYNNQETIKKLLMNLIPLDKQLAREVADAWEKDLFDSSKSSTIYTSGYNAKHRELKMHLDILRNLPKL